MKEIRSVKLIRKLIEDKEIMQQLNLITEKYIYIYRKEIDDLNSKKSETEERDRINI